MPNHKGDDKRKIYRNGPKKIQCDHGGWDLKGTYGGISGAIPSPFKEDDGGVPVLSFPSSMRSGFQGVFPGAFKLVDKAGFERETTEEILFSSREISSILISKGAKE